MLQLFTTLLLLALVPPGQGPPERGQDRKPVLIRDERADPRAEVFEHNPAKAREYVEVGDFYHRRDKYEAAESRYRDAIRYDRTWPASYEKLIDILEKNERFSEAIEVCTSFLEANPESKKREDFESKAASLREKLEGG